MSLDLLFQQQGGGSGGGAASAYDQDNFRDVILPPSNNIGFTSALLTNPLSQFYANDANPKYGAKTLFIKDLVLVQDRTQWVNGAPTYTVVWNENFPGVTGYCFGDIRLRNYTSGKSVDIRDVADGFAVGGIIRRVAFLVNGNTAATGTATVFVDGVANGTTVTFGSQATSNYGNGVNLYNATLAENANETQNIHDFRITALQSQELSVVGVVVYFEDAGLDINVPGGIVYVNAQKNVAMAATLPVYVPISPLGAKTLIYSSNLNVYTQSSIEATTLSTIAQGSSGTNLITVTTGQGGSFAAGTGFVVTTAGGSLYVGGVGSRSTDTLTVGPTLPFGLSGSMYKAWMAGPTLAVSATLNQLNFSFDPGQANVAIDLNGFGQSSTGNFYYNEPNGKYRAWGRNLRYRNLDGTPGIDFAGATLGFLQFDGFFSAAEIEWAHGLSSILHFTAMINGVPGYGINEGSSGFIKRTVFTDAGAGWNSFALYVGASMLESVITKVNLYGRASDTTVLHGRVSEYANMQSIVARTAINASYMALGTYQRIYADQLYLNGSWVRGVTFSAAGGVLYYGASTNSQVNVQFYGKDFAYIGTASSSCVVTLDGASIAVNFNAFTVGTTLGFHKLSIQNQSGTLIINAFDYTRTVDEFKFLSFTTPRSELDNIPVPITQADTPRNPIPGTIWARDQSQNDVWIYLFDRWNKFSISNSSDDPNVQQFFKLKGSTNDANGGAVGTVQIFNFVTWQTSANSSNNPRWGVQSGHSVVGSNIYTIDGYNTSGTLAVLTDHFNKTSWQTDANNRSTAKGIGAVANFLGKLSVAKGRTNVGVDAAVDTFDGTSWANGAATLSQAAQHSGAMVQGGKLRVIGGGNAGGSTNYDVHDTWDGSSTGTDVVYPAGLEFAYVGGNYGANGIVGGTTGSGTASYTWSGSWSTSIIMTYGPGGDPSITGFGNSPACGNSNGKFYISGGTTPSAGLVTSASFDGSAWRAEPNSPTGVGGCGGGVA